MTLLACKVIYYNTKTKLDLTKLFLLEVSQLQWQIYVKILNIQIIKAKNSLFAFKNTYFLLNVGFLLKQQLRLTVSLRF